MLRISRWKTVQARYARAHIGAIEALSSSTLCEQGGRAALPAKRKMSIDLP
jgi:hypothetical protein